MAATNERFGELFEQLRSVMADQADGLVVKTDVPGTYYLDAPRSPRPRQDVFFGAVRTGKRYVSYHLMPVYVDPSLLDEVPTALKRRMQGKSCFNFTSIDEATKAELARLTRRGVELYRSRGMA